MDIKRARQIVSSPADIDVTFEGVSVWIDKLHEDQKMATVHLRGPLEERTQVAIKDLEEEKE